MKNKFIVKRLIIFTFLMIVISFCIIQINVFINKNSSGIGYIGYGANKTISGSLHVINIDGEKIILDAGLFYDSDGKNNKKLPKGLIKDVSAIIVSHAHLDHIGRLLDLINMGYRKYIYCTEPTKELMYVMLKMSSKYSSHGLEKFYFSKSSQLSNKEKKKNTVVHIYKDCKYGKLIKLENLKNIKSKREDLGKQGFYICSECINIDVQRIISQVKILPLNSITNISPNISVEIFKTPHLPGSVMIKLNSKKTQESILFSGDLGSGLSPFLPEQEIVKSANYAIIEGTYGVDSKKISIYDRIKFQKYIGNCIKSRKRVIIPSFVLDRSQQVLYEISKGIENGFIPEGTPVKVFSPTISTINKIYSQKFTQEKFKPFFSYTFSINGPFKNIFQEYSKITYVDYGEIAISSSGMADYVYSKEFVKNWIGDPNTVFIFVGYQDSESIGGKILDSEDFLSKEIEIDSRIYKVNAEIKKFICYSSHANYDQIKNLLRNITNLNKVLIVHLLEENIEKLIANYKLDFPNIQFIVPKIGKYIKLSNDK